MPFKNQHPLYVCWKSMRSRCANPKDLHWVNYGARGIKVCDRWQVFANFLADMGERPPGLTLDRRDNDGDYEPGNCRWATRREQQVNRRMTIRYAIEGKSHLLADLARDSGLKADTIKARIASGLATLAEIMSPERRIFLEGLALGIKASSIARKARTHCKRGHPFDAKNTGQQKGGRYCKACDALRARGGVDAL